MLHQSLKYKCKFPQPTYISGVGVQIFYIFTNTGTTLTISNLYISSSKLIPISN